MSKYIASKYIVTCALPYANGPLHVGHLAGCYIPGDIYARYRRMEGDDVHFLCGSDEHGVAITFRAIQEGTTPQAIVDKYHKSLKQDLIDCGIEFDVFSRTTHPCHIARSQEFFTRLTENGLIERKAELRLYCDSCQQFLPDRYVVGQCPKCGASGARGDQCEKCGSWYEPEELINPICQICKTTTASMRETIHWYLLLDKLEDKLRPWLESKTEWRKNVLGYAFQPLKAELVPRAITRDLDWGVPVPLPEAAGKVLYVWFDAPIGYISASEDWSIQKGEPELWRKYWEDKETKLIHFIGKDNIVFHTVIWPAILIGDGRYILPEYVAGNEFLNLEGEKISTSRNFAVWARDALDSVPADCLRFYLTRISPELSDSNFSWSDYQGRINGELADIIGNLVHRHLSFILNNYGGKYSLDRPQHEKIAPEIKKTLVAYRQALDQGFSKVALEAVLDLARFLNGFFQESAPWKIKKSDPAAALVLLEQIAFGLRAIAIFLAPITPKIAQNMWQNLGYTDSVASQKLDSVLFGGLSEVLTVPPGITPLVQKVEDSFIEIQKSKLGGNR